MSTDDDDDGGTYIWDRNTDLLVPLTFTNWNKHQPGSQFLQVCYSEINTAKALGNNVLMNGNIFASFFFLPQSVVVAALLCQVGPLWVGGRLKTAGLLRLCHCASKASTMTMISSCRSTSIIPTPPVLQGGNHRLSCCYVLRYDCSSHKMNTLFSVST